MKVQVSLKRFTRSMLSTCAFTFIFLFVALQILSEDTVSQSLNISILITSFIAGVCLIVGLVLNFIHLELTETTVTQREILINKSIDINEITDVKLRSLRVGRHGLSKIYIIIYKRDKREIYINPRLYKSEDLNLFFRKLEDKLNSISIDKDIYNYIEELK